MEFFLTAAVESASEFLNILSFSVEEHGRRILLERSGSKHKFTTKSLLSGFNALQVSLKGGKLIKCTFGSRLKH